MENIIGNNPSSNSGTAKSADNLMGKTVSGVHGAVDSIAGTANEAVRKAQPAIEHVAGIAHQAVDKVVGAAGPTAEWLAAQGDALDAKQKKLMTDTCNYVAANPLKSIGIAVLAGFLLSRITR